MVGMLKRAKDVIAAEGTEGRNPFEVLVLFLAIFSSLSFALNPQVPGDSAASYLPHWMVISWFILLCTGGLAGLVGVLQRNQILSLLVERVAMAWTGTSALLFGIVLLYRAPAPLGWQAGISVLAFALASLWRLLRIQSYIRKLRTQLSEAVEE